MRFISIFLSLLFFCCNIFAQPTSEQQNTSVDLNTKNWAFASLPVVNIRSKPGYPEELSTQVLMGTPLKLLAKKSNWYKVQTPEGYEGWTSAPFVRLDESELHQQNQRARVIVIQNNTFVYSKPNSSSEIIAETVMGNLLWLDAKKAKKGFFAVSFPDGRAGYVDSKSVKTWQAWQKSIELSGNSIEKVAKRFLGVPYFWGGTSSRGLDCSGLTKTSYLMHGIILPRDARQQYLTGQNIDSTHNFSHLQKGDLLFFGSKYPDRPSQFNIVHTAIYLGNQQFIQAGNGYVYISSLNPNDHNFDRYNTSRYVTAKRILDSPENGTSSIFNHPWYK